MVVRIMIYPFGGAHGIVSKLWEDFRPARADPLSAHRRPHCRICRRS